MDCESLCHHDSGTDIQSVLNDVHVVRPLTNNVYIGSYNGKLYYIEISPYDLMKTAELRVVFDLQPPLVHQERCNHTGKFVNIYEYSNGQFTRVSLASFLKILPKLTLLERSGYVKNNIREDNIIVETESNCSKVYMFDFSELQDAAMDKKDFIDLTKIFSVDPELHNLFTNLNLYDPSGWEYLGNIYKQYISDNPSILKYSHALGLLYMVSIKMFDQNTIFRYDDKYEVKVDQSPSFDALNLDTDYRMSSFLVYSFNPGNKDNSLTENLQLEIETYQRVARLNSGNHTILNYWCGIMKNKPFDDFVNNKTVCCGVSRSIVNYFLEDIRNEFKSDPMKSLLYPIVLCINNQRKLRDTDQIKDFNSTFLHLLCWLEKSGDSITITSTYEIDDVYFTWTLVINRVNDDYTLNLKTEIEETREKRIGTSIKLSLREHVLPYIDVITNAIYMTFYNIRDVGIISGNNYDLYIIPKESIFHGAIRVTCDETTMLYEDDIGSITIEELFNEILMLPIPKEKPRFDRGYRTPSNLFIEKLPFSHTPFKQSGANVLNITVGDITITSSEYDNFVDRRRKINSLSDNLFYDKANAKKFLLKSYRYSKGNVLSDPRLELYRLLFEEGMGNKSTHEDFVGELKHRKRLIYNISLPSETSLFNNKLSLEEFSGDIWKRELRVLLEHAYEYGGVEYLYKLIYKYSLEQPETGCELLRTLRDYIEEHPYIYLVPDLHVYDILLSYIHYTEKRYVFIPTTQPQFNKLRKLLFDNYNFYNTLVPNLRFISNDQIAGLYDSGLYDVVIGGSKYISNLFTNTSIVYSTKRLEFDGVPQLQSLRMKLSKYNVRASSDFELFLYTCRTVLIQDNIDVDVDRLIMFVWKYITDIYTISSEESFTTPCLDILHNIMLNFINHAAPYSKNYKLTIRFSDSPYPMSVGIKNDIPLSEYNAMKIEINEPKLIKWFVEYCETFYSSLLGTEIDDSMDINLSSPFDHFFTYYLSFFPSNIASDIISLVVSEPPIYAYYLSFIIYELIDVLAYNNLMMMLEYLYEGLRKYKLEHLIRAIRLNLNRLYGNECIREIIRKILLNHKYYDYWYEETLPPIINIYDEEVKNITFSANKILNYMLNEQKTINSFTELRNIDKREYSDDNNLNLYSLEKICTNDEFTQFAVNKLLLDRAKLMKTPDYSISFNTGQLENEPAFTMIHKTGMTMSEILSLFLPNKLTSLDSIFVDILRYDKVKRVEIRTYNPGNSENYLIRILPKTYRSVLINLNVQFTLLSNHQTDTSITIVLISTAESATILSSAEEYASRVLLYNKTMYGVNAKVNGIDITTQQELLYDDKHATVHQVHTLSPSMIFVNGYPYQELDCFIYKAFHKVRNDNWIFDILKSGVCINLYSEPKINDPDNLIGGLIIAIADMIVYKSVYEKKYIPESYIPGLTYVGNVMEVCPVANDTVSHNPKLGDTIFTSEVGSHSLVELGFANYRNRKYKTFEIGSYILNTIKGKDYSNPIRDLSGCQIVPYFDKFVIEWFKGKKNVEPVETLLKSGAAKIISDERLVAYIKNIANAGWVKMGERHINEGMTGFLDLRLFTSEEDIRGEYVQWSNTIYLNIRDVDDLKIRIDELKRMDKQDPHRIELIRVDPVISNLYGIRCRSSALAHYIGHAVDRSERSCKRHIALYYRYLGGHNINQFDEGCNRIWKFAIPYDKF